MAETREVVIVGAARTPIGSFLGALASVPAARLGATVIREALIRARVSPGAVDEVILGNVIQAGEGQAPARQAALFAGLPDTTPSFSLNKMCGSGLKAILSGAQAILSGDAEIVVAGGMESMSNIPYLAPSVRTGARMGNVELVDAMLHDGLLDAYDHVHMGICAEETAARFGITRAEQDEFALLSTRRAQEAQQKGLFKAEIRRGRRGEPEGREDGGHRRRGTAPGPAGEIPHPEAGLQEGRHRRPPPTPRPSTTAPPRSSSRAPSAPDATA